MVCEREEGVALCIVEDKMPNGSERSLQLHLPASSTIADLLTQIQSRVKYDFASFDLVLTASGENMKKRMRSTAAEVGLRFGRGLDSMNCFAIVESTKCPVIVESTKRPKVILPPSIVVSYAQQSAEKDSSEQEDSDKSSPYSHRYVGLVNQAMTCYLNSLLQALYMTPEFRNALYKWEYVGSSDEMHKSISIPYQLQRLFVSLQTSNRSAVETTKLTRSFGWDSSDSWQQHDVQELCRVMFDALEQTFKNTDQADFINNLYEGKMIDYVKCLQCGTEKSREDTFLDIPLPVRPFGSSVAYDSVEQAMRAFVQPETLDGNNQYFCEKCNEKCDAHKGLKFSRFPYVLTLHLKRFDFDYVTLQRIKLTDRVEFPQTLNINSFVPQITENGSVNGQDSNESTSTKDTDMGVTDTGSMLEDEGCQSTDPADAPEIVHGSTSCSSCSGSNVDMQDYDEGIDITSDGSSQHLQENEKNRKQDNEASAQQGPYIYELFSIMIHSGSASGGHYYAYIKDFKTGDWFCFNDQSVTQITNEDISKTYGGGVNRTYYSSALSSSTSAYMLMYRQLDKERNVAAMTVDEFPPHLQDLMETLQEEEKTNLRIREQGRDCHRIKVFARNPKDRRHIIERKLVLCDDATLAAATSIAHSLFHFDDVIPLEQCRLVGYNIAQNTIKQSYEGKEEELMGDVLSWHTFHHEPCLLLETRVADARFETYNVGCNVLKVYSIHMESGLVDSPVDVPALLHTPMEELRYELSRALKLPVSVRVMMECHESGPIFLTDYKDLTTAGFRSNNKIFIAPLPESDDPSFDEAMYKIVERFCHTITLYCSLPSCDKESRAKLGFTPPCPDKNNALNGDSDSGPLPSAVEAETEEEGASAAGDQSTSEDSSLTDSDRTIVNDECWCWSECSSSSSSPQGSDQPNLSSEDKVSVPREKHRKKSFAVALEKDASETCSSSQENEQANDFQYLQIFSCEEEDGRDQHQMVRVQVDKRMRVCNLISALAQHIGVSHNSVKLFRKCGSKEMKYFNANDPLIGFRDEEHIELRLQRALHSGEFRGKVYQLVPGDEPAKFLCDWILTKDMLVGDVKRQILEELKKRGQLDQPPEKCRLRRKNWKNPGKIFLDSQSFNDLLLVPNWEMYLQDLPCGETVTSPTQVTVMMKRLELGHEGFHEITLQNPSFPELAEKVSEYSGIPLENLAFARPAKTMFPHDTRKLQALAWGATVQCDLEDGVVIFYCFRNTSEDSERVAPKRMVRRQRMERDEYEWWQLKERKASTLVFPSPRKERALKIHVDSPAPQSSKESASLEE